MKYNVMIGLISKHLADELISESEMLSYTDRVVDDINTRLNAKFPTFTEFKLANPSVIAQDLDYNCFPDKYIRTVVIPGAAHKYYTTDEEGSYSSPKYEEDYNQGLFYMVRDYSFQIPEQYQESDQGYLDMKEPVEFDAMLNRGGLF
jgi:hypothetical protein